jgi:hypothetical protein
LKEETENYFSRNFMMSSLGYMENRGYYCPACMTIKFFQNFEWDPYYKI